MNRDSSIYVQQESTRPVYLDWGKMLMAVDGCLGATIAAHGGLSQLAPTFSFRLTHVDVVVQKKTSHTTKPNCRGTSTTP